jgi:nucleotide-binding universal stress UspA family protein
MFKTIVWATDGSELADSALDHVRELALEDGSKIVAVHANELMRGRSSGYPALADEPELEEKIGKQIEELRSVGIDATFEIRSGSKSVAALIAQAAEDVDADLIVVATHGAGGVTATLMGSVARALCHTARTPLLVIPPVREPAQEAANDDSLAAV